MGFDGVFFARIDWEDYAVRQAEKGLELLWSPSQSLGSAADIYAHVLYGESNQ